MIEDDFKILRNFKFEDMGLPPILYKYRYWENIYHKRILTHNELFLASPASFEDSFDCKIPIRYDLLTDKEIFEKYNNLSKEKNPNFNRQEHRKYAKDWQKKRILRDKNYLAEYNKDFFEKFHKSFGVLSLTASFDNYKMWDDYANHYTGFCVGFHTIPLVKLSQYFGGGGEIVYDDNLPIIKATDTIEKQYTLLSRSKLRKWEDEKEYRLTKFMVQERKAIIPSEIFAEIIISNEMPNEFKNKIIEIAIKGFPNAPISIAYFNDHKVTINRL